MGSTLMSRSEPQPPTKIRQSQPNQVSKTQIMRQGHILWPNRQQLNTGALASLMTLRDRTRKDTMNATNKNQKSTSCNIIHVKPKTRTSQVLNWSRNRKFSSITGLSKIKNYTRLHSRTTVVTREIRRPQKKTKNNQTLRYRKIIKAV